MVCIMTRSWVPFRENTKRILFGNTWYAERMFATFKGTYNFWDTEGLRRYYDGEFGNRHVMLCKTLTAIQFASLKPWGSIDLAKLSLPDTMKDGKRYI